MKRLLIISLLGLAAVGVSPLASARVSIGIGIGVPGFVAGPPVVYAPPPQPYYAPPPVVYGGGGYYGGGPGWGHRDYHRGRDDHGHGNDHRR
jgi:hypothetical protein